MIDVYDVCMQLRYVCAWCHCSVANYLAKLWKKCSNFKQCIEYNRLKKELLEKIGEKRSKMGLSLYAFMYVCMYTCTYICMYACMHVCMYACM